MSRLQAKGLEHIVLCPGSRSAPLAMSVGLLAERNGINFYKVIDERSAGFLALGISAASGKATVVITTSGTAVSNLLPAAVEADRSCLPIIFITADRPHRLKNCGANQTVNQEDFLKSVCRNVIQTPRDGVHLMVLNELNMLAEKIWDSANSSNGPVHLNVPIEEPLHPSFDEQREVCLSWEPPSYYKALSNAKDKNICRESLKEDFPDLDPNQLGLVLAGPFRGKPQDLNCFRNALREFQEMTGWPVFADPLSGVSEDIPGRVDFWELLISSDSINPSKDLQILRLGPMPSSKKLELFINKFINNQVLITEGDKRCLDPFRLSRQYSKGFHSWMQIYKSKYSYSTKRNNVLTSKFMSELLEKNKQVHDIIDKKLNKEERINEISLSRYCLSFIPKDMPIMLSASSPVRDFLTYSASQCLSRRCFSFRGASGIDGNISLGIGLSTVLGPLVLICGDLAFLHDSFSLSLSLPADHPLIILLIDNKGGGIFKQLGLDNFFQGSIENLFTMPPNIDHFYFAKTYNIPYREVSSFNELGDSFKWGMSFKGPVLIRIPTNSDQDSFLRKNILDTMKKYIN